MLQFPKLRVIDGDENLDGPERTIRHGIKDEKGNVKLPPILPTLDYAYDVVGVKDDGSLVDPADCYDRAMLLLKECIPTDFTWIGFEGLTSLNEYIIRKVMKEQKVSYLEARNWSTFKSDAIAILFTRLRHLNKNVIVTAHEVRVEKADPKNMMTPQLIGYEPFIQSKVSEMIGGFFTDVWRIETELVPGNKLETTLYTDKVPLMKQLKNSFGLPPTIKNPTYAILQPYLERV